MSLQEIPEMSHYMPYMSLPLLSAPMPPLPPLLINPNLVLLAAAEAGRRGCVWARQESLQRKPQDSLQDALQRMPLSVHVCCLVTVLLVQGRQQDRQGRQDCGACTLCTPSARQRKLLRRNWSHAPLDAFCLSRPCFCLVRPSFLSSLH